MYICTACKSEIYNEELGHPFIKFKDINLCHDCALELIEPIYRGTLGGIAWMAFQDCLSSNHGRKRRKSLKANKELFKKLLHKYKFKCCFCGDVTEKNLTVDHIKPVAKGGTDAYSNLQILCRSCNSKKGTRYPYAGGEQNGIREKELL